LTANRSLRSLTIVIIGWVSFRVILLNWPLPRSIEPQIATAAPAGFSPSFLAPASSVPPERQPYPQQTRRFLSKPKVLPVDGAKPSSQNSLYPAPTPVAAVVFLSPATIEPARNAAEPTTANWVVQPSTLTVSSAADRWAVSAWLLQRGGAGEPALASNGQLGGSQIGLRAQRELFRPLHGIETKLNLRMSSAIGAIPSTEAAIGLSFSMRGRVPVELLIERRQALTRGGRSDFAIVAITGLNEVPVAHNAIASAYVQAGAVGLAKPELFVDGAVRFERQLTSRGPTAISLGVGGWGAIQRGASRVDIGPIISSRFRIGKTSMRMSAEWRERLAGRAAPASGPALSLGMDF
jgi:hypothetical protein